MVRTVSFRDLEVARNRLRYARDSYKPSPTLRKLTSAAMTIAFVCGIYVFDRFFINSDFLNNPQLHSSDKIMAFTGAISGLVGGLGLVRRMDETTAKRKVLVAEENLEKLTKDYVNLQNFIDIGNDRYQANRLYPSYHYHRR